MRKVIGIGETVFDILFRNGQPIGSTPGGSTFNSMISIGRTGIPACFIGETGEDKVGELIRDFLIQNHVSADGVCIHKNQKSALSLAFLNEHNDAQYVFYKDHARDELDFVYPEIHPDDVVLFGSYYAVNLVVRHQVGPFLEYARKQGAILYYDVNFRASHRHEAVSLLPTIRENLKLAHIVRGSDEDFKILYDLSDGNEVFQREILPFCGNFIYTRASQPAEVRTSAGLIREYPVSPIKTVSTVGAGDSFNAGFIYGLIKQGITLKTIQDGLSVDLWNDLVGCAQKFAANVCQHTGNAIDGEFAQKLRTQEIIS